MVIRTRGLTKTYVTGATEVRALRGVDFDVRQGEMVAIMGASGSGKSTLMNILGCLDRPTSGTYELDGIRVDGMDRNALADIRNQKHRIRLPGLQPAAPHHGAGERGAAAALRPDRAEARARATWRPRALERVGLGDRMDHEPSELSGGQQQRVAHRPRPGHRAGARAGRRTDRKPGHAHIARGPGPVPGTERTGDHDPRGHPRARHRPLCETHRAVPGRAPDAGRAGAGSP